MNHTENYYYILLLFEKSLEEIRTPSQKDIELLKMAATKKWLMQKYH